MPVATHTDDARKQPLRLAGLLVLAVRARIASLKANCTYSGGASQVRKGEVYPAHSQAEKAMAIQAQRNRARLHVLRDNVHRAKRDVKRNLVGAAERLKMHVAARLAYAETRK